MEGGCRWSEGVETGDITANLPSDNRSFNFFIQEGHELCHSCQKLMKFQLFDRFLKKILKYQTEKSPSSESRVVPCGRTWGWGGAT
jgi:hypothetical protein